MKLAGIWENAWSTLNVQDDVTGRTDGSHRTGHVWQLPVSCFIKKAEVFIRWNIT